MEFAAGVSLVPETERALDEALAQVEGRLAGAPHLLFQFATPHHREGMQGVARRIQEQVVTGGTSIGCLAQGVVGGRREFEEGPALVLWGAVLPAATWRACHLRAARLPEGVAVSGWEAPPDPAGTILLSDPYTFPTPGFVAGLASSHPGMPVVGGVALAGPGPGHGRLVLEGEVHWEGAVALALGGDVELGTVVSQGCRPVGEPAVVTAAEGSELLEIAGKPALEFLQDLFDGLPLYEKELVRAGLQLGVVVDEYRTEFDRGDFLVRAVVGADPDRGSLSLGEEIPVGKTVQFQVRDPLSADEDLRSLLSSRPPAEGVLLFTCNGRGRRFFGAPDHDASVVGEVLGSQALAGFFAAGELGPVGGRNFLHGYTATLAEFRAGSSARR